MDYSKILYSEISFKPAKYVITNGTSTTNGIHNGHNNHTNITSNGNHHQNNSTSSSSSNTADQQSSDHRLQPRHQLCDPSLVKLDWVQAEKVGGGLINVGNTCFLNSVLQCLTYCPPLYNFLVKQNGGHSSSCKINQFCMLCEMEKHVKRIKNSSGSSIKPVSIVQRLKYINKSFQFGRQEDAHEFLRYLIDHMWKACLMNLDINVKNKLDPKIKETTVINHIFGGYHRSQVLCLSCNSRSNTFDFFMDFMIDIKNAKSLEDALRRFTQPETLENENAYRCSKCRKKVTAKKKFTVYKAPNVATFQLKRFDSDRIFGGKVTKFISYPEELDLRPFMSESNGPSIKYQLSAVLVHVGHSSNSGHYFCFIKNSNNFWYRMDDSNVSLVSQSTVLQQQAYVLFYTRKQTDKKTMNGYKAQELSKCSKPITANNHNNNVNNNHNSNNHNHYNSNNNINNSNNHNNHLNHQQITPHRTNEPKNPSNSDRDEHANNSNNNGSFNGKSSPKKRQYVPTPYTTWSGSKSKLDHQEANNNSSDRDKFNDEIDQGKLKKIKSHNRDATFSSLSKTNPFRNHVYQQYNNHHNNYNK